MNTRATPSDAGAVATPSAAGTGTVPAGVGARFAVPVLVGPTLNPINTTMISVALVPISQSLRVPASATIWLVAGLYVVSAVTQPTWGRIADRWGPRRVYLIGLAVLAVAGVLPSLSPTFTTALVARLLIGLGTSTAYPAAMTFISDRARATAAPTPRGLLTALSVCGLATSAVGPVLGGVLVEAFGWQSIFLVNTPLALITAVMAWAWLPADRERTPTGSSAASIDPVGIVTFAVTVVCLLVFLLDLREAPWVLLPVGLAAGVGLVAWERRRADAFLDVRLLAHNRGLTLTYVRMFLSFTCLYLMVYALTQWVQAVAGYSADAAGLLQLPGVVCAGLAALAVGRTSRLRLPLILTAAVPIVGGLLVTTVHADSPLWLLVAVTAVFGIPQGMASVANQAALYRQAPPDRIGTASGLSRTAIYLGAIVASSIIGMVYGQAPTDAGAHTIGWIVVGVSAAALALTCLDRALGQEPAPTDAGD